MDAVERTHVEQLLQIHRAHLHELEVQAAKWGNLSVPSHITLQIAEYNQKIAELEERVRQALPRHNLPPRDYERFVGRQRELEEVRRLLLPYPRSRHHLVTIDGIGGIGKSALALETAYSYREGYAALPEAERFEAIVWVSAKRIYLTAGGILQQRQLFRALDDLYTAIAQVHDYPAITRAPAAEQRAIVEQVLSEQRTLLILDNLETVDDEELLVFLRLLPDPTKAIVTTRHRIDVAYPVRLTGMPHADALALIAQEAARKGVTLAPEEQEELWARTGGVPLAIVWSIGLIGLGGSVASVLRRLGQGQSDIARFCFEESVAQIRGRDAHRLLLALALFEAPVSREMLGQVAGLGEDEFGRDLGLEELLRLSLVNKEGEWFSLMPLTQSYVGDELARQPRLEEELQEKWIACLTALAKLYDGLHWRWRDRYRLRQEGKHLVTLADWCQQSTRPDILLQIVPALMYYYDLMGQWTDLLEIGESGLEYARLTGKLESIMFIDGWMNWIFGHQHFHNKTEIYSIEAINIANQLGDVAWKCSVLLSYSQVLRRREDFDRAIDCCQQALQLAALLKEMPQKMYIIADIEYELGKIARDQGDWQKARSQFLIARNVFRHDDTEHGFNIQLAWGLLCNLGFVAYQTGDLETAAQIYLQCFDLYKEGVGKGDITTLMIRMAALEEQRGNREAAVSYAHEALEWTVKLGMHREQAEAEALLARLEGDRHGSTEDADRT